MKLEFTLRDISQTQIDKYHLFCHVWDLDLRKKQKKHESRRRTIWEELGNQGERERGKRA
jgi:inhibitor of KinA sporulation pathway (predicted exonuclease)